MRVTNLELKTIAYHRNGISGVGFHVAVFIDHNPNGDGKSYTMLGVLFDNDDECYCCAFDLKKLAEGNVAFGDNSFRGDYYVDMMRAWAADYEKEQHDKYADTVTVADSSPKADSVPNAEV